MHACTSEMNIMRSIDHFGKIEYKMSMSIEGLPDREKELQAGWESC